jgi:hypothetical protein
MDGDSVAPARVYAQREVLRAGLRAGVILVAYFVMPFGDNWLLAAVLLVFVLFGLLPFAARRFRRVLRSDHPVGDAVGALLITLMTLIVSFAASYYVISERDPAAIHGLETKVDSIYFEVTILSTVGFGDITATTQGTRILVTINMLMAAVFLGVSLRLLTWTIQRHGITGGDLS